MTKKSKNKLDEYSDVFSGIDKLNPDAETLDASTLSVSDGTISTGCYALNAIISGSLYGGVHVGRFTGFIGPSQCGKTYIINKCIANAQKDGYIGLIFDSEIAVDKKSAESVGCDPKKIKYYPVDTLEDCRNQICTFLDAVIKSNEENPNNKERNKFIISIDSLGNLSSAKELKDIAENKEVSDMGSRSKVVKSLFKSITYKAAKARVPILFSNHIYDDPTKLYPSIVKTQNGGKGPVYLSSVLVQFNITTEKIADNPNEQSIVIAHTVSGTTLGSLTIKNRFIPAFLKTELYLNFKTGLDPYAGLFDLAVSFNVIKKIGKTYEFNGESLGFKKNIVKNADIWEKVMPELEKVLQDKLKYGGEASSVIADIVGDVDDLEYDSDGEDDSDE